MSRPRVAIYDPALHLRGGGEKYAVTLAAALAPDHQVELFGREPVEASDLEEFFGVNLSGCAVRVLPPPNLAMKLALRLRAPHPVVWALRDQHYYRWFRRQRFDHFYTVCFDGLMPCPAPRGTYSVMFPSELPGWRGRVNPVTRLLARIGFPAGRASLITHTRWVTNSAYTAGWTRRYWGDHPLSVLYPQCDDVRDETVARKKVILNVGRFFDLGEGNVHHHKRQDVLVEAFAQLDQLHADGWELHLAGAVSDSPAHQAFLDQLRQRAAGAPVVLHPNASFDELRTLYNQASLYWHATGYGTRAQDNPSAQEHFGIAVVEAMSAGAVPLVYGTAGPAETVTDGLDGRHWHDVAQLAEQTRELAAAPQRLADLSAAAIRRAADFGPAAFERSLRQLDLEEVGR